MRVTLKTVNHKLAELRTNAELAKGAGYFLFRGGEADDWIDRTVYGDMLKAAKHAPPKPAKRETGRHATPSP
jgi:hypothetical protein